LIKIKLKN